MIILAVDLGKARTGIAVSDNKESFAFLRYFAIIIPWQQSGNSSSCSQWKLCRRNKNEAH